MPQDGPSKLEIREYWGFVSYSHADEKWAVWLHRYLERYRFPRRLRGRKTAAGIVPKSIAPLFRDRDEFAGASDLTEAATLALRCSRSLIVLCSPSAARSEWVGREVHIFKSLGRSHRVFCCIVGGDPARPAVENFPEAVTESDHQSGISADTPVVPLACDARPGKDGKRNAALKLLAAIVDIPYDELHARERRRRRFRWGIGSAVAAVICATLVLVLWVASVRRDALGILQAINLSHNRQDETAVNRSLWQLTTQSFSVRSFGLDTTSTDRGAASVLVGYPSLIEASAGLSPTTRRKLAEEVLDDCYDSEPTIETGLSCTLLATGLDEGSLRGIEYLLKRSGRKYDFGETSIGGISQPTDLSAAEYMARRIPPKDVAKAFDMVLSRLEGAEAGSGRYDRSRYFHLLWKMADRLSRGETPALVTRVRALRRRDQCGPGFVLTSISGALATGEAVSLYREALDEAYGPHRPICSSMAELLIALLKAMEPADRLQHLRELLGRLEQPDGADYLSWSAPVIRHFAQELSPDDWREYVSRVVPSASAANLKGAASRLAPVPAQFCTREAARLFSLLMGQKWLYKRDSIALDDSSVHDALIVVGGKLAPADAANAVERISVLMKDDIDPYLADVLDAIPGELSLPALAPVYDAVFHSWQTSSYERSLRSLSAKLPPAAASGALERVLEQLRVPSFRGDGDSAAAVIEALAARMPASTRKKALPEVIALMEREPLLPCRVLVPFAREETFPLIVAVAKWPTCAPADRNRLIQRAGEIAGQDFGHGSDYTDIWGFIRWAEKRGYDVETPPSARLPRTE